jgi:outer membrane lipoprotein-sorting protein
VIRYFGAVWPLGIVFALAGAGTGPGVLPVTGVSAPASGLTPEVIMRAQENLAYSGTMLINGSQHTRILHDGPTRQRQEFLTSDGQINDVVVSDGQIRWHYMARLKTVKVMPLDHPHNLERRLALLQKNYRFAVMGQAHQAGRLVLLTQFTPVHHGNMVHRLWVDFETHLPLVTERRTEDGRLVDRSEFTHIEYGAHFDAQTFRFKIPDGSHVESATTVLAHGDGQSVQPKVMSFHPALPRELPEGYALLSWQYFLSHTQVPTFNWRFADGLNLLSLFATDENQAAKMPPDAKRVNASGLDAYLLEQHGNRMLTWKAHGVSYTLVGHLPQENMLQIARSTL